MWCFFPHIPLQLLARGQSLHGTPTYHMPITCLPMRLTPFPGAPQTPPALSSGQTKAQKSPEHPLALPVPTQHSSSTPQTRSSTACRSCSLDHIGTNNLQLCQHNPSGQLKRQDNDLWEEPCQKPAFPPIREEGFHLISLDCLPLYK